MNELLQAIKSFMPLPDQEARKLTAVVHSQSLTKGDVFIAAGSVPQKFGFVRTGIFRYFYSDSDGNEFTKGFFPESTFLVSYSAMATRRVSYFTIEALEDSTIDVIDFSSWQQLYKDNTAAWSPLLIALLEKGYAKKENREREFLLLDAEARYRSFLKEYPSLDARVRQHYIASYLGITPVALSRIRKRMTPEFSR